MKWMGGVCCLGLSPENRFLKTDFLKLSLLGWSCNPRKWKPPGKHSALQGATQRPLRCPTAFGTACVVPKIMGGGHCSVFLLREGGVMSQRLIWTFFMLVIFLGIRAIMAFLRGSFSKNFSSCSRSINQVSMITWAPWLMIIILSSSEKFWPKLGQEEKGK